MGISTGLTGIICGGNVMGLRGQTAGSYKGSFSLLNVFKSEKKSPNSSYR